MSQTSFEDLKKIDRYLEQVQLNPWKEMAKTDETLNWTQIFEW